MYIMAGSRAALLSREQGTGSNDSEQEGRKGESSGGKKGGKRGKVEI